MAAPKRSAIEILRDRVLIAELYCKGWTQTKIAERIGVSQAIISRDLNAIRKEWLESSVRDFDGAKAQELAKLDHMEQVAWAAWERSVGPHSITTETEGTNDKGLFNKSTERTEHLVGNPAFLQAALNCIDRRCKILGIDAAQKLELDGNVGLKYLLGVSEDDL